MPEDQKAIVVVGSINMDMVTVTDRLPRPGETVTGKSFRMNPGGKGANQAVAIGRLGYPVRMIGRLGTDEVAGELRKQMQAAGVDVEGVAVSPGTSGVASIVVSEGGENSIVVTPGANGLLSPGDIDANLHSIRSAAMVLTQLEIPMETVLHLAEQCERLNIPLMLDPAPARHLPRVLLRRVAWFTPNETEAAFFVEARSIEAETAAALISTGPEGVVLKLGARGAYFTRRGEQAMVAPFRVHAVDATAAGDAFNGAFATSLCLGKTPVQAVTYAAAAAALCVTRPGAQGAMPRSFEVEQMMNDGMEEANASVPRPSSV